MPTRLPPEEEEDVGRMRLCHNDFSRSETADAHSR